MKLNQLIQRIALNHQEVFPPPEECVEDFVSNTLAKSETLQKAFEVSPYEMEEIYNEAYRYYQENHYVEASTAFRWLVLLNPFIGKYWRGLAASLQLLNKYEKALHAYAMTALLESDDPYPHFYAYECYKALKNKEEAARALQSAYAKTNKPEFKKLKEEIGKLIQKLEGNHVCTTPPNTDIFNP